MMLKIWEDGIAKTCLISLCIIYILIVFSDFIAPYNPNSRDPKSSYLPPSKIHFFSNSRLVAPYINKTYQELDNINFSKKIIEDKTKQYPLKLFIKGEEYKILGLIPSNIHLFGTETEERFYLFGTDRNGRDIFSRIIHGGRPSLTIGFIGL